MNFHLMFNLVHGNLSCKRVIANTNNNSVACEFQGHPCTFSMVNNRVRVQSDGVDEVVDGNNLFNLLALRDYTSMPYNDWMSRPITREELESMFGTVMSVAAVAIIMDDELDIATVRLQLRALCE